MADKSAIEWTDATWNPIRGCTRVSTGCEHCYAEQFAARFSGPGLPYEGLARMTPNGSRWTGEVRLVEERLEDPLRWKRPRRIFVNSMSDLFHENIPNEWIDQVFAMMARCPQHRFQVLTKRPDRMMAYCAAMARLTPKERSVRMVASMYRDHPAERLVMDSLSEGHIGDFQWPLRHVWLGFSAENQTTFDERWVVVHQVAEMGWFVWASLEPLLGPINLRDYASVPWVPNSVRPPHHPSTNRYLDWVVVGGESGRDARSFNLDWVHAIIEQCRNAEVPVFIKQLGSRPTSGSEARMVAIRDSKGGDSSEWPEDLRIREMPVTEQMPEEVTP